jgi:biopolymer transport protein TolR
MQGGESRGTFAFEPNVIPMIDILLVLLIIFMLMNIGERRVFELQLPLEDATRSAELPIVLEVRPGGVFAINQEVVRADDLANRLEGIFAGRPRKVLFIQGDPRVRYQDVTAAIDVARGAGVVAIGVAPKSTPQSH